MGSKVKTPSGLRRKLKVTQVANQYGCDRRTVRSWIHRGWLAAIDTSPPESSRPRYLIDEGALETFDKLRTAKPAVAKPDRRGTKTKRRGKV